MKLHEAAILIGPDMDDIENVFLENQSLVDDALRPCDLIIAPDEDWVQKKEKSPILKNSFHFSRQKIANSDYE